MKSQECGFLEKKIGLKYFKVLKQFTIITKNMNVQFGPFLRTHSTGSDIKLPPFYVSFGSADNID